MMSGAAGLNFNTMTDLVRNNTAAVAKGMGCVQNGDNQSKDTLEYLRQADVNVLANLSVSAMRSARPPFGEGFFYPTYDSDFLPDRPSELVRSGRIVKDIPIIASWVSNDGAWYAPPPTSSDKDVLSSFGLWLTGLLDRTKKRLLGLYPIFDFKHMVRPDYDRPITFPQYYRATQLNRDLWFTCPVLDFAWQYRRKQSNSSNADVWRVAHLSDIPYVLNAQQLAGMGTDNSAAQLAQAADS